MAYQTFRVEITRDETRDEGPVGIEITAYIDRMPETNEATIGRLSRAWRGVWNSRLQYTGDFDTLAEALEAITAAYPEADRIRCTNIRSTTSSRARSRRWCDPGRTGCPSPNFPLYPGQLRRPGLRADPPAVMLDGEDVAVEGGDPELTLHRHLKITQ